MAADRGGGRAGVPLRNRRPQGECGGWAAACDARAPGRGWCAEDGAGRGRLERSDGATARRRGGQGGVKRPGSVPAVFGSRTTVAAQHHGRRRGRPLHAMVDSEPGPDVATTIEAAGLRPGRFRIREPRSPRSTTAGAEAGRFTRWWTPSRPGVGDDDLESGRALSRPFSDPEPPSPRSTTAGAEAGRFTRWWTPSRPGVATTI